MLTPYDSHNISKATFLIGGGKRLYISHLTRLVCFVALMMAVVGSVARPVAPTHPAGEILNASAEIHFQPSSSGVDPAFDGNGDRLDDMLRKIQQISSKDSTYNILSFRVEGFASPEGTEAINRQIAEKRAHALFDYFAERITLPESKTEFEYGGRNWKGLYNLVVSDQNLPSRTEVLALLQEAVAGPVLPTVDSDRLLGRLKTLKGGEPYNYMFRNLFPELRCSNIYVKYEKRHRREISKPKLRAFEAPVVLLDDSLPIYSVAETLEVYTYAPVKPPEAMEEPSKFYMDLSTNMLFDIAAVPNLGAEFYIGKNFTVLANWMYGWWDSNPRHRYWRIYGGELGARWWFGSKAAAKPLTGHHLGIYSGVLIFDFEWGGTGYMGGKPGGTLWDRCLVNSGIEYGYSLPIGPHLNIDFSIGLGYLGGNYIKYFPFDNDYYRDKEYKMRFFGPTKAQISLVWLIGRGNTNRKGGER